MRGSLLLRVGLEVITNRGEKLEALMILALGLRKCVVAVGSEFGWVGGVVTRRHSLPPQARQQT